MKSNEALRRYAYFAFDKSQSWYHIYALHTFFLISSIYFVIDVFISKTFPFRSVFGFGVFLYTILQV